MTLIRLVYVSTAVEPFTQASLQALVDSAAARNARLNVTGVLLFGGGNFMQVLEGPRDAVDDLFRRIEQDPRHLWVEKVQYESVDARLFEDWSMALCDFDESAAIDRRDFRVIRTFLDSCVVDEDQTTHGLVDYFTSRRTELAA